MELKHAGRSLLVAALLLVAVGVWADRAGLPPSVLTGIHQSMQQYESFRIHVARDGPHDLIVLGNSVARQSVLPRVLRTRLRHDGEAEPRVYNFGSGGTAARTLPFIVELAYGVDQPRYCVIVLIPRMFTAWRTRVERERTSVAKSPYGRALADPLSWRSDLRRYLLDRVGLFSQRYPMKDALLGIERPARRRGKYNEDRGYRMSKHGRTTEKDWETLRERLHSGSPDDVSIPPLVEAIGLAQSYGARVWIVEGALHPRAIASLPDPGADMRTFREIMRKVGNETGAEVLLLPPQIEFGASEFSDTTHFNTRGAEKYTRWLAEELRSTGVDD